MRQLKTFARKNILPALPNVSEEFNFVESIARNYAGNFLELETFYQAGLSAALEYKEQCVGNNVNLYDRFVTWIVVQAILSKKSGPLPETIL